MEKALYFFIHLGIPILILILLFGSRAKTKSGFLLGKIFQVAVLSFLFQWGQYAMVGSYYLRYVLLFILILVIYFGWRKWSKDVRSHPNTWRSWILFGFLLLGTPLLLYMNYQTIVGLQEEIEPVDNLEFPLKNGLFYVSSGGTTAFANNHFRQYPNSQQYAIDINQINRLGSISGNVISSSSEKHIIFNVPLYSPCGGIILETRNDVPDNVTTSMAVDHDYGRGNYIDMQCGDLIISMSHLREGSIVVQAGDRVAKGQHLGQVGNSGFSQEPHLHIQAAKYRVDSVLIGVPVTFDNRWLVRNMLVDQRQND